MLAGEVTDLLPESCITLDTVLLYHAGCHNDIHDIVLYVWFSRLTYIPPFLYWKIDQR